MWALSARWGKDSKIKWDQKIIYTFAVWANVVKVYIIFLSHLIIAYLYYIFILTLPFICGIGERITFCTFKTHKSSMLISA